MSNQYLDMEEAGGIMRYDLLHRANRFCYPVVKLGPAANCHEPGKENKEPRWIRRARKNGKYPQA